MKHGNASTDLDGTPDPGAAHEQKPESPSNGHSVAVAVAVADQKLRRLLLDGLELEGLSVVDDACDLTSPDSLLAAIGRIRPDILFLGLDGLPANPEQTIARLTGVGNGLHIVAVSDAATPDVITRAMRAGAAEFVFPPFISPAFEEAITRVVEDCARAAMSGRVSGAVVGFVSAKGGCGATTLACHSAAYLRRATEKQVLVADLDAASGVAGAILQTSGRYNIQDAFENLHRMDLKLWKTLVSGSPSGVDVIPAPAEPPFAGASVPRRVATIVRFWQTQYDFTVADFGHGTSPTLLDSLETLDSLVIVTTNEVLALRQAKNMIQALSSRGFSAKRLRLVINRMPNRPQIGVSELEKIMGQPVFATIPDDSKQLTDAYREPRLLDARTDLAGEIGKFAARLMGIETRDRQKGFLRIRIGRNK